jgi:hypothetical protein
VKDIVFLKAQFWILVCSSLVVPAWVCWYLLTRRSISRNRVLLFGLLLLALSALNLVLLPALYDQAKRTATLVDDAIFASEYSVALYLLPLLSAGLGINLISHVLRTRLSFAEIRHDREEAAKSHAPASTGADPDYGDPPPRGGGC